jgi:hypothetical protein
MTATTTTTDDRPTRAGAPLLVGAAMAAAAAGLVHAAAAGSHDGQRSLMWLFALTAAVQLGWAALTVARPGRAPQRPASCSTAPSWRHGPCRGRGACPSSTP